VLVGVGGGLASALAAWRQGAYAASELADRRSLRFPPAVRTATLVGARSALDEALAALPPAAEVVGTTSVVEDGSERWRAVLRFDYAAGGAVAQAVRAEVIRLATARRSGPPGPARGRRTLPLRAHFDDPSPFEE